MEGICNKTVVDFFAEKTNDDIKKVSWRFSFQLCNKFIYKFINF